jgi:colanic acid biosynthesis glycosyl transferase WcaI
VKRIWIISEFYYPEDTATGYYLTKIAEGLAKKFSVSVICSYPMGNSTIRNIPYTDVHNGVVIYRCFVPTFNKNVLFFRVLRLLSVSLSIFWKSLLKVAHGDIVLVVTNPPSLPFITRIVCWLHGAKSVLLIHDVYPDVLIASGMMREQSLLARFLRLLNRRLYESVNHIIVIGRDMCLLVKSHLRDRHPEVEYIPHWADVESIVPMPRLENPLLLQLHLIDKFVFQYSGNIGRTHDIESIVAAAQQLLGYEDIHFLFIGDGAKRQWLEASIRTSHLRNMTILPPQPREILLTTLNACDVAIISFVKGMKGVSVPSRMYNIFAAGKPIIALTDPLSELGMVINEEQIGWVIPQGDIEALVKAILAIRKRTDLHMFSARAVSKRYQYSKVMEKYYLLMNRLV